MLCVPIQVSVFIFTCSVIANVMCSLSSIFLIIICGVLLQVLYVRCQKGIYFCTVLNVYNTFHKFFSK